MYQLTIALAILHMLNQRFDDAMRTRLLKLLKIHEDEGSTVLRLTLIGALLQAGVAISVSASSSLFLTYLGADKLPYVYFVMPLLMAVVVPVYSNLIEARGVGEMITFTLIALASGGVTLFAVLALLNLANSGNTGLWLYYAIEIYTSLWQILIFTILWMFVEEYFDILSAKRLFPVLGGGAALGAIFGGAVVVVMTPWVGVAGLFLVWAGTALAAYPIVTQLRRTAHKVEDVAAEEMQSFAEQLRNVGVAFKSSPYVVYLNLAIILLMFLTTICEYQYLSVFEKQGDEETIATLFGQLTVAVNVFNLVVSVFLFNRLVSAIGVRNTALIQPLAYLGIFGIFVFDLNFAAAIIGFFVGNGLQDVVEDNNWNFMLNPVPSQVNRSIRAVSEGVVDPLGSSLAGLFLLLFVSQTGGIGPFQGSLGPFELSLLALAVSLLYLWAVMMLRRHYLGSMVDNLRRDWLDFSRSDSDVLSGLEEREQQMLREQTTHEDLEVAEAAVRVLWLNHRTEAVEALLAVLARVTEAEQTRFGPLLAEMLATRDDEVLRCVVNWLEQGGVTLSPSLVQELGYQSLIRSSKWPDLLVSPDLQERAAGIVCLGQSWAFENRLQAIEEILKLFRGREHECIMGIRALGYLQQEGNTHYLTPYLGDASRAIRQETLMAVKRLASHESGHLLPYLLRVMDDDDAGVRLMAMDTLTQIGDSDCIPGLLEKAGDLLPFERRKAERLILSIGLRSIPGAIAVFRNPSYAYEARSIAARAIAKLAFPQLRVLLPEMIDQEIERAYQYLYNHSVLAVSDVASPGLWVLSCFYADAQLVILEFILEILALGGRLPDYEMFSSSLRSRSQKARANAIEALEQACPRSTFVRLLPLVDARPLQDTIAVYRRRSAVETVTPQDIVEQASLSRAPLERSAAVQAMWDLGMPDVLNRLRRQLHDTPSALCREVTISLLIREDGEAASANTIERISQLSRTSFFRSFHILDLVVVASGVTERRYAPGDPIYHCGDMADTLFVIKDGTMVLRQDDERCEKGVGDTFGEAVATGAVVRGETAISQGLSVYVLAQDYLMQCVRRHPRLSLTLLEKQMVS